MFEFSKRKMAVAGGVVALVATPAVAVGAGEGLPVDGGARNPSANPALAYTSETQIIANTDRYGTRQSNKSNNGGGAIYGCRSGAGGTPARNEPCIRASNLVAGLAFEFSSRGVLGGTITVQNGIGRVEALGPGFLLISRSALERVAADGRTPTYTSPPEPALLPALFRDLSLGSAVWSHDHVFCRRWAALGGETWVYVHAQVRRIAEMRFGMPYRRFLEATLATAGGDAPQRPGALAPESTG